MSEKKEKERTTTSRSYRKERMKKRRGSLEEPDGPARVTTRNRDEGPCMG
jgi:hypothetical protein